MQDKKLQEQKQEHIFYQEELLMDQGQQLIYKDENVIRDSREHEQDPRDNE